MTTNVVVDRRWYLTQEKDRVVEEGDPAAFWLWAAPGDSVPRVEAEKLGAVAPKVAPLPEPEPSKQMPPAANKMAPRSANKGR